MSRTSYRAADATMAVVVMLVVTLRCCTVIDTAAVVRTEVEEDNSPVCPKSNHSYNIEILDQHLQNIILHGPRNMRVLRTTEGSEKDDPGRNCYNSPCAWEVYEPHTRVSEYTIKNSCECPDSTYKCVRSSDVLSAGAYAYYCRQNTTVNDIEYPKNAN